MSWLFSHHADEAVDQERDSFWIVCAISNPERYRSRYELYKAFRAHVLDDLKCNLCTVECAHGDRSYQVTSADPKQPQNGRRVLDVQVRNESHIWLKENLMNLGASRLPPDAKYVMFCDADVTFQNKDIVTDTIHALQVHKVVQPFETTADLGPHGEIMQVHKSFGWCHAKGFRWSPPTFKRIKVEIPQPSGKSRNETVQVPDPYGGMNAQGYKEVAIPWHPGWAHAMKITTLKELRGLLDIGILGASDHHMLLSMIGQAHLSIPAGIHTEYVRQVMDWQDRALKVLQKDLGYVRGSLLHAFHGSKDNRKYISRWGVLTQNNFNPLQDIYKNLHGVWEVAHESHGLRDGIRRYFAGRAEDAFTS